MGYIFTEISQNILDTSNCNKDINSSHGEKIIFLGVVRNINLRKKVLAVSYEAFIPLAEKTLRDICIEAQSKFEPALDITCVHRIGKLKVGEISLFISTSSPHREASYQSSRYIIEEIKKRAPIWKKEHYEEGESEWLKGHTLCEHV